LLQSLTGLGAGGQHLLESAEAMKHHPEISLLRLKAELQIAGVALELFSLG
jgi:hypothetical protein